jgi:hypothetical protein
MRVVKSIVGSVTEAQVLDLVNASTRSLRFVYASNAKTWGVWSGHASDRRFHGVFIGDASGLDQSKTYWAGAEAGELVAAVADDTRSATQTPA